MLKKKPTKNSLKNKSSFIKKFSKQITQKSIDLYYFPTPNTWKITIMLEECNCNYNIKVINLYEGDQFKKKFVKISPNSKIPTLVDHFGPNNEKIAIFESCAILKYLALKFNKFYHSNFIKQAEIDKWLFFQAAYQGPITGQFVHFINYNKDNPNEHNNYAINRFKIEVHRICSILENQLIDQHYITGNNYTIADIALFGWARILFLFGNIKKYPNLSQWYKKISKRNAIIKGCNIMSDVRDPEEMKKMLRFVKKSFLT